MPLPPRRVLAVHAARVLHRGGPNLWNLRRLARDPDARLRALGARWRTASPSEGLPAALEIEKRRLAIGLGELDSGGLSAERLEALAHRASKSPRWAALIFDVVASFRPDRVLEMGTAVGISGAYIAAALDRVDAGSLVTVDNNVKSLRIARETFDVLDLAERIEIIEGSIDKVLPALLDGSPPFDLVFKDAIHTEEATLEWFERTRLKVAPNAAILFDDIRRDGGMLRAWNAARNHEEVCASIDFFGMGIVVLAADRDEPTRRYRFAPR